MFWNEDGVTGLGFGWDGVWDAWDLGHGDIERLFFFSGRPRWLFWFFFFFYSSLALWERWQRRELCMGGSGLFEIHILSC